MEMPVTVMKPAATPIALELSPRDLFCAMAACEAAAIEMITLDMDNEMQHRLEDMFRRFNKILKDGGHI